MTSYKTLAILALAASVASPALSAPVREIQERALNRRELATRFGGLPFLKNMKIGKTLGNLALMAAISTAATDAGSAIFHAISKPASDAASKSGGEAASGAAGASGDAVAAPLSDASATVPTTIEPPTRRAPDLLSRDDLEEALRLITRMLRVDELD